MLEAMSSLLIYFSINMLSAPVLFIPTPSPTSRACALTNPKKKGSLANMSSRVMRTNIWIARQFEMTHFCPCCHPFRATMSWWWDFQGGGGSEIKPKSLLGNYSGGCISRGCKAGQAASHESKQRRLGNYLCLCFSNLLLSRPAEVQKTKVWM